MISVGVLPLDVTWLREIRKGTWIRERERGVLHSVKWNREEELNTECKWAVREVAPNRLVCRWTHYLSDDRPGLSSINVPRVHIKLTRLRREDRETYNTRKWELKRDENHFNAILDVLSRAEISNIAMSSILTKTLTLLLWVRENHLV